MAAEGKGMPERYPRGVGAGSGPAPNRFRHRVELVMLDEPQSHASEEFRKVAVRLQGASLPRPAERGRFLAVQSPLEGEGKTLVAVNLALALAEEGQRRTLLVDLDLRRPSVEQFLVERGRGGLADHLRGACALEDAVQHCARERLFVLTAGRDAERQVTALSAERLAGVLESTRRDFDWVVADSPPLLPFAESRVLASLADAVLLVARAERTPRAALTEAVELVDADKLIGIVLNDMPVTRWRRYGYDYSYRWRRGGQPPEPGPGGAS